MKKSGMKLAVVGSLMLFAVAIVVAQDVEGSKDHPLISSGGFSAARESLGRGLGSRWFTERFHRNALVTHFQHGQVFCTARQLKDYAVTRCRLHQRAPQG